MRRGLLGVMVWLLLGLAAVRAQDDSLWQAWLYNPADGRMTLIDDGGTLLASFRLPLPDGFSYYPFRVSVAQGGSRIAYVANEDRSGAPRVLVYDVPANQLIVDYVLFSGGDVGYLPDDFQGFNATDSALAFGYSLENGGWQIAILDLESGFVTLTLRRDDPAVIAAEIPQDPGLVPVVRAYGEARVIFSLLDPDAVGDQPERGSFAWNLARNTLHMHTIYPALDQDTLAATGEIIMTVADPNLPNDSDNFTYGQANALYVYEPQPETMQPFFSARDLALFLPRFVQGGRRILVGGLDAEGQSGWLVIERDGAGVGAWTPPAGTVVSSLLGTADGFLYTADTLNADGGHATLFAVNLDDSLAPGVPLWSSSAGNYPRLIWVGDRRAVDLSDVRPWGNLSDQP